MTFADWFGASPARTRCVRRRRVRHEQRAILTATGAPGPPGGRGWPSLRGVPPAWT
jgi:hypothetical protein